MTQKRPAILTTMIYKCFLLFLFAAVMMAGTAYGHAAGSMLNVGFTDNFVGQAEIAYGYMMPIPELNGAKNITAKYSGTDSVLLVMWPVSKKTGIKYPTLQMRCTIVPKKKTTGVITISGKLNGKKKIVKIKLTLLNHKYVSPVKTLKIGKVSFQTQFKKSELIRLTPKKWKALFGKKIKVTPAKGWKLVEIRQDIEVTSGYPCKTYKIKNNGTLKKPGKNQKCLMIGLVFQNTKTGMVEDISLYCTE